MHRIDRIFLNCLFQKFGTALKGVKYPDYPVHPVNKFLYLNFNVDKLSKANNIATITNLKTIFGSFHPDISK